MRYILDTNGYIDSISCTPFNCKDKGCQEYTGAIPEGYSSLEEWAKTANIRAYKIASGNLTYDADRNAALEEEYKEWKDLTPLVGTWAYLQYRRIGNQVFIRGRATAYAWSTNNKVLATIPTEITPANTVYTYSFISGVRMGRVGINNAKQLFYDWSRNISDGSEYSTSNWHQFDFSYFLD